MSRYICNMTQVLTTYLMMTTYFWMLGEGIFLWIILVRPFAEEEATVAGLCILGWVTPALVTLPYIGYR